MQFIAQVEARHRPDLRGIVRRIADFERFNFFFEQAQKFVGNLRHDDKALGGGQASRLFSKIRSEQGLAYAVWSFWGESYDYQGAFSMGGSTKSGTTVAMVKSILKEFEGAVTSGITESELRYAKESFLNSFVFEFDTKAKVINKLMTLEYYGYPKDYYQKQQQAVQNATLKAVNEAMQKRWKPEVLSILVVGK